MLYFSGKLPLQSLFIKVSGLVKKAVILFAFRICWKYVICLHGICMVVLGVNEYQTGLNLVLHDR